MAIDIIPGVGPTNADIATAVAAPSAATIASAVAAPSAASIAAAVAAPSAATIAAAVAAPSAATIASTVAAPSLASITSAIQANAGSPFGGTWTNLGVLTSSAQTISFTGLSSYKYLRFSFWVYNDSAGIYPSIRLNGDSSGLYTFIAPISTSNSSTTPAPVRSLTATEITPQTAENSVGQYYSMNFEIFGAQSGAYKTFKGCNIYTNVSSGTTAHTFDGTWRNTAAVSSVTFLTNRASSNNWTIYAQGAN
jgi:hypothetical protein